jgi:putative phosphoribosyl transferase
LKFHDRVDAGNKLAKTLHNDSLLNSQDGSKLIILGIPRGGMIIAEILAKKFSADLDIAIGRRLGAPKNPELAIGAVMEDGTTYLNDYLVKLLRVSQDYLESERLVQIAEVERRVSIYRGKDDYKLRNRTVILADDGIATGATVIAAARWIRKHSPSFLMIAVPIAPSQTMDILRLEVDAVHAVFSSEMFASVGQFYENFEAVSDEEVRGILATKKRNSL